MILKFHLHHYVKLVDGNQDSEVLGTSDSKVCRGKSITSDVADNFARDPRGSLCDASTIPFCREKFETSFLTASVYFCFAY